MKVDKIISILRNPYDRTPAERIEARLEAAERLELLIDAVKNLREYARLNGLKTETYGDELLI